MMQTPKTRNSSEAPKKVSPRAVRQLKTTTIETAPASSSPTVSRTPKDRSPKVTERRSPRSPTTELQKKRPNRVSELESQISQLQEELNKVKDQLTSSESSKKKAEQDAENSQEQLLALSSKLEESQKQLLELSTSDEAHAIELQKLSQDKDQAWQAELESIQKQHSADSAALASATEEIQKLQVQLQEVADSEAAQKIQIVSTDSVLLNLQQNLAETSSLVQDMKIQSKDGKQSDDQAQALINETLQQLEIAKKTVETLRSDGIKAKEASTVIVSDSDAHEADCVMEKGNKVELLQLEAELRSVKAELGLLRTALETAESQSTQQIENANKYVEQMESTFRQKETALEEALNKAKAEIEDLKANMMDKETELQGISEENECLNSKLEKSLTRQREQELEKEMKNFKEHAEDLKAKLANREAELKLVSEKAKLSGEIACEVEAAKAAEQEALMKLGYMTEEADKSKKKAQRVAEELEVTHAATSEMEAELRRLKVQSDQWRKAAEAAATILSSGNNGKIIERTGSMDNAYSPMRRKVSPPYSEDIDDDDLLKKKNGNVLKKIGVLWKKPQK